eukprot:jgi/Ulvmu1/1474/UM011_0204.1
MDHAEEQEMEMEALESILGDDGLRKYTGPPPSGWSSERDIHAIKLSSESEEQQSCSCDLLFQHTKTYPEEPPLLKLSNTRGLSNSEIDKLTAVVHETADENVGMASVFAIMQAAQDWLEAKVGLEQEEDPAVVKKREEEAEERRIAEARAQGTPVTPESFAAWKEAFEAEMQAAKVAAGEVVEGTAASTKKTGKQFFLEKYGAGADSQVAASELDLDEDEEDADYELGLDEDDEVDNQLEGLDDLDLDDEDDDDFLDQYLADKDDQ